MQLDMNQTDWRFVEGAWAQDEDGTITAPGSSGDGNLAICTAKAWKNFEAEFDFRWDCVWTNAGFVFRATDAQHYYMVHFPVIGQQYRAEHFWAFVSKVDQRGYTEVLKMEMIHGVSSTPTMWHHAKVAVNGNEICLWGDGRPMSTVVDDTYPGSGYVGLQTYHAIGGGDKSSFRNLQITGRVAKAKPYNTRPKARRNAFTATKIGGTGCANITRLDNRDLLTQVGKSLIYSKDNARTWRRKAPALKGNNIFRQAPGGDLEAYSIDTDPPFKITRAVSRNRGKTWSRRVTVGELKVAKHLRKGNAYPSRMVEMKDGTLCIVAYVTTAGEFKIEDGRLHFTKRHCGAQYCIRSTDGGKSWSDAADLDGEPRVDNGWLLPKEASETSVAQLPDGKMVALVRPFASPVMWETWSENGGETWTPLARGPFPMYACNNSMISTANGAIIVGGRFPGMAVQVSHDGGMTWKCYEVDVAGWANGAMFEVRPNVVFFLYGAKEHPRQMRGQFIRITEDGIEPVK